jgi:hypothetical protein
MDQNSIFISQNENSKDSDLSGKITYTSFLETIPHDKRENPLLNWKNKYKTEWRWRFLLLKGDKNRDVIEISYIKNNSDKRIYINKYGVWVERVVDPIFDQFVKQQYFYYT